MRAVFAKYSCTSGKVNQETIIAEVCWVLSDGCFPVICLPIVLVKKA